MILALAILETALLLAAACGWGSLFIRGTAAKLAPGERRIMHTGLGLGLIAYLTLAAAACGLIGPLFFIVVLLAGNLILIRARLHVLPDKLLCGWRRQPFMWILVPLATVNFFYSLFPPTFYDSMLYHLAVPAFYLQQGKIAAWPTNVFSNMPQTAEMLHLFALLGQTVLVPKILAWCCGFLLLLWLARWPHAAPVQFRLLPALLVYSIPLVGFLASSSKPDIFGLLFLAIAVRLLLIYLENRPQRESLAAAALFCGLALSTKYIQVFPIIGLLASACCRRGLALRRKIVMIGTFGLIILLVMAPWLAKNLILTGNPVYPYLSSVFPSTHWSGQQGRNLQTLVAAGGHWDLSQYLRFAVEMFTRPYHYGVNDVLGLMLLFTLPFIVFGRFSPAEALLARAGIFSYLLLLFFGRVPRYFIPAFLLLAIPMAAAMAQIAAKHRLARLAVTWLLLLLGLANLFEQVGLQERFSMGFRYFSGRLAGSIRPDVPYLSLLPYYPAAQFINHRLAAGERIALLGEERTFYIKKSFLASSFVDANPVLDLLRRTPSPAACRQQLQQMGISHFLVRGRRVGEIAESPALPYRMTATARSRIAAFFSGLALIYQDRQYYILQLNP